MKLVHITAVSQTIAGAYVILAVKCSELSPPNNGELLGCNTTEMLYNTVCRFSCDEGSAAKGSMVRRCTENGTWSGTDPVCIGNRPRSIYQYSNMAPRLSSQTSKFGVVFFVSKSLLGIEREKILE